MKSYLLRSTFFLILYLAILLCIYLQPYKYDNFFQSAETKTERLKKKEPQIIFVGGSNTLFGVDSKMVVEETGYDVVNMGIHMALGYKFQTNQVLGNLEKGDIVLLSPEYTSYFSDLQANDRILNQLSEHYPSVLYLFQNKNRLKLLYNHFLDKIKKNVSYMKQGLDYDLGPVGGYSFSGVNEYGDQTDHLKADKGKKMGHFNMRVFRPKQIHEVFIEQTNKLYRECEKRGCQVFFTFPAIAKSAYDGTVADIVASNIDELDYVRLGHPSEYVFESNEFYDTHYHPLKKVRGIRTSMVIDELKKQGF